MVKRLFNTLSGDPDCEYAMIDGAILRIHKYGIGVKGAGRLAIGRSHGGLTTKIIALFDALGNLASFVLLHQTQT